VDFFKRKKPSYCVNCSKMLKHKYKPRAEWNLQGLLCGDCHIEKTREFILKEQQEKEKAQERLASCTLCQKEFSSQSDGRKPKWQWNMQSESLLCKNCFDKKDAEFENKINYCFLCKNKLGFIRYNPKPKWNIDGQLCRACWDQRNKKSESA